MESTQSIKDCYPFILHISIILVNFCRDKIQIKRFESFRNRTRKENQICFGLIIKTTSSVKEKLTRARSFLQNLTELLYLSLLEVFSLCTSKINKK